MSEITGIAQARQALPRANNSPLDEVTKIFMTVVAPLAVYCATRFLLGLDIVEALAAEAASVVVAVALLAFKGPETTAMQANREEEWEIPSELRRDQEFSTRLAQSMGMEVVDVPGDGHCMLHAIHQAQGAPPTAEAAFGMRHRIARTMREEIESRSDLGNYLRAEIAETMRNLYYNNGVGYPQELRSHLESLEDPTFYFQSDKALEDYCTLIEGHDESTDTPMYCGDSELKVLAEKVLQQNVHLHRLEVQEDGEMKDACQIYSCPTPSELPPLHLYHSTIYNHFMAFSAPEPSA